MIARLEVEKRSAIPQLVSVLPPESYPVGARDYLAYANIKLSSQTHLLQDKVIAAIDLVEGWTGQALITRTTDQIVDYDPENNPTGIPLYMTGAVGEIDLRQPPVRLVTQVHVRDPFRVETLVDPDVYRLMTVSDPYTKLIVQLGQVWPGILSDLQAIRITTICGYATKIVDIDIDTSIITVSNGNPYSDGDIFRLSTSAGSADDDDILQLPAISNDAGDGHLDYNTNYLVTGVSGNSFQLTDMSGIPILFIDSGQGNLFAGEVPKNLLRAVMITAVKDFLGDESDETSTDADSSGLPKRARDLCARYKRLVI